MKHILPFCNKDTLLSLLTSTKQFAEYAEHELYSNRISILSTPRVERELGCEGIISAVKIASHPFYMVIRALASKPERATWIRFLELEIITDVSLVRPAVEVLLEFCHRYLTTLHFKFKLTHVGQDRPWTITPGFPRLTRLDLTGCIDRGLPWVLALLHKTPNVHTLRVQSSHLNDTPPFINTAQPILPSSLPNIRILRITHLGEHFPNPLLQLIRKSENVEKLVLNQTVAMVRDTATGDDDIWGVVKGRKALKMFVWKKGDCREFAHLIKIRGGFQKLEEVVLGDKKLRGSIPGPKVSGCVGSPVTLN